MGKNKDKKKNKHTDSARSLTGGKSQYLGDDVTLLH